MIQPKKYSPEEIEIIIDKLREKFPEITEIKLSSSDPRFILLSQILCYQRVDTIPIPLIHNELIHITEAEQLTK